MSMALPISLAGAALRNRVFIPPQYHLYLMHLPRINFLNCLHLPCTIVYNKIA